jgi:hypothetical protein
MRHTTCVCVKGKHCLTRKVCRDYTTICSDTTNIDQSVAEWLKNVVEGAEATGHPLEHVFFEEGEHSTCCFGSTAVN